MYNFYEIKFKKESICLSKKQISKLQVRAESIKLLLSKFRNKTTTIPE